MRSATIFALAVFLLATSCGRQQDSLIFPASTDFKLSVLPESLVDGGQGHFTLAVHPGTDTTTVDIVAADARQLKALYYKLEYDTRSFAPLEARATGSLAQTGESELLQLAVLREPGAVTHGQVLANWPAASGFTGSATLAHVVFTNHPLRQTAAVPLDATSQVHLSYDTASHMLNWRYASRGDYDQNSLVTIADLTPLGAHFGASGPFPYVGALSVIDGDGNGLINISDITPIGASFGNQVSGYNVYSSSNPAADYPATPGAVNGAGATLLGTVPFSASTGPVTDRRLFQMLVSSPASTDYFWVRPTNGTSEGIASSLAAATGTVLAPTAAFSRSTPSGPAPLSVNFDASLSNDPDGTVVKYEWDWDGDGTYDLDNGANAFASHTYSSDGTFNATLRVTDNDGYTDAVSNTITVGTASNAPPTAMLMATPTLGNAPLSVNFDATGSADSDGTLTEYAFDFDGDGTFDQVGASSTANHMYTAPGMFLAQLRVTDNGGAQASDYENVQVNTAAIWHVMTLVPGTDSVGQSNSLAVVEGNPAVAWINNTTGTLNYMSAADPLGTAWNSPSVADNSGTVGLVTADGDQVALLELAGEPAMAYYSNTDLYFVRASDSAGTTWGTPPPLQLVSGTSSQGTHLSMALVGGQPAIAYYDFSDNQLHYIRADSGDGTSWLNPPHALGHDGKGTSLIDLGGKPAVSFEDSTDHRIWFSYSSDADGADGSWTEIQASPDTPANVEGTSLALIDGLPAIAYGHIFDGLKYVRALDSSYTIWSLPVLPNGDDAAINGYDPSMVEWNGKPAISYSRGGACTFRFVQASDADGAGWQTPQEIDPNAPPYTNCPGYHSHLVLVNNHPAASYWEEGSDDLKFAIYY